MRMSVYINDMDLQRGNVMLIPQSFRVGRKKFKVERHANSRGIRGVFLPEGKRVIIFNAIQGKPRADIDVAETFWHEVTHVILQDMQHPQWKDEAFVVAFSKRLNQAVHTADLGN